jgi:hypothetical protein
MEAKLDNFLSKWTGIKQRTPEWYKLMGETLGMSEMAALLGENKYKSREQLIIDKIMLRAGKEVFQENVMCNWGIIFEDMLGDYVSIYFQSKLKGDSICMQQCNGIRCSPDGYLLAAVYNPNDYIPRNTGGLYLDDGMKLFTIDDDLAEDPIVEVKDIILMLEFKCPWARKIDELGVMYRSQVQGGLCLSFEAATRPLPNLTDTVAELADRDYLVDHGLFVDALFRRCRVDDFDWSSRYDRIIHKFDKDKYVDCRCLAQGILFVHDPAVDAGSSVIRDKDYGAQYDIEKVIERLAKKQLTIIDNVMWIRQQNDEIIGKFPERFNLGSHVPSVDELFGLEGAEGGAVTGYFSYKLLDVHYTILKRNTAFLDKIIPLVDEFFYEVEARERIIREPESKPLAGSAKTDILFNYL